MMLFSTGKLDVMQRCRKLSLQATIKSAANDGAQFFFLPTGASDFSERDNVTTALVGGQTTVTMVAESATGFLDRLRFDPIYALSEAEVSGLTVHCIATRR